MRTFTFPSLVLLAAAAALALPTSQFSLSKPTSIIPGQYFDRVVIVILENEDSDDVAKQSFFKSLTAKGRSLTNYFAVTHPSEPNYIALTSGGEHHVNDDNDVNLDVRSIVDLLEPAGISWKAYMENYPGGCFTGTAFGNQLYRRKHNPFISYTKISGNPTRCANIVNAKQLDRDVAAGTVPQFVWYTPNMNNDGHDTGLPVAAKWLKGFLSSKLTNPNFMTNTLLIVTFDESESYTKPNKVYTALLGPVVPSSGVADNHHYTHYSILKTIENNWHLGSLTSHDASARPFSNLVRPS